MQIEIENDAVEQALAAGFATPELYVTSLLERDAERIAIQRGVNDWKAGRFQTLEEVDRELRAEFGFQPRKGRH